MTNSILSPIPAYVLDQVSRALNTLRHAHDEILIQRALEQAMGAPGRYEWEYRTGPNYPDVDGARDTLEIFSDAAARHGIDAAAVYEALDGYVEPPEWSDAAIKWLSL